MIESDLDQVLAIEHSAYEFPWSRRIFTDCLRAGYCSWVLLDGASRINAYCIMSVAAGECHILNLCVQPQWQGTGMGRQLLDAMLEVALEHKVDTAFLEVRPTNQVARQLYNTAGFDEVGMRRNYYPARRGREDAIIMARSLISLKKYSG
ncbi:MAG: ribosomal protein S18-alanine N-acetyltransferase [Gammaproteobacteria bacterium]